MRCTLSTGSLKACLQPSHWAVLWRVFGTGLRAPAALCLKLPPRQQEHDP